VSLFEKLVAGESSEAQDRPLGFTLGTPSVALGDSRALHHESAIGHVTGQAMYVDDQAQRRGRGQTLVLWPVMSPHASARISRRDVAHARQMPGVHAVLLAEDIPGENDVGAVRKDEILLATDRISFHGQMVAVVVGESYELCRAAAAAVQVDYEPLPALLSIEQAIVADSYHGEVHTIERGDAKKALADAQHRLEGVFELGGQEHFYLESQAAYAERGDDGDVFVVSSTQHPSEIQGVVSHVLHLPRNKVVVQSPRMGGGFGGKETQGNTWAALVALAAWRTGRRVRVQLDRDLDMTLTGKRHPFRARFEVGFDSDGRIQALIAELTSDGGWALDLSQSILDRALFHIDNSYYIPSLSVSGRVAKTNMVSHTAFRGFGGPQGMLVTEEIIDRIARATGLSPTLVRERNLYHGSGETNTTHYGQPVGDDRLERIWSTLKRTAQLDARRREVDAWNLEHAQQKRGLAMTPVKFGISFTASFLNQAGALVMLYRDGTCQVNHGGTEMGQGLYTKILGIAMRELSLSASAIRVMKTQTDKVPNTSATAASAGADLNGAAVKHACEQLRARLWPLAVKILAEKGIVTTEAQLRAEAGQLWSPTAPQEKVSFGQLCDRAHLEQVSLSATGFYRTPNVHYDRVRGRGKPFHYFACGAAVVEVEVDARSGMKRVLRVDILHDVGDSLNPSIDRGQIEGGFVQGVGWLTGEELRWDEKGRLLSHSASTYQIPAISDAPVDFRVTLLPDAAQSNTIHGSKAVGEPPLMLAIAAREAIRDAVSAFAPSANTPITLPSPATHEAIYDAIRRLS
jgi:xanthine dehydrogenase molybdopterin binding subunit